MNSRCTTVVAMSGRCCYEVALDDRDSRHKSKLPQIVVVDPRQTLRIRLDRKTPMDDQGGRVPA